MTAWQTATVVAVHDEAPGVRTFRLALPAPSGHRAGQHYVLRLTAEDGYSAQRSYSVASAPDGGAEIELTVERLDDGEVSTYLHDVVRPGDAIDVRGPIGGWFAWDADTRALLVGGGIGLVPLVAMLRLARARDRTDLVHLVASVRTPTDLPFAAEMTGPEVTVVHSRRAPPGSARPAGRLTAADLAPHLREDLTAYVCGSTPFAETVGALLVDLGLPAGQVRVERFGPSG